MSPVFSLGFYIILVCLSSAVMAPFRLCWHVLSLCWLTAALAGHDLCLLTHSFKKGKVKCERRTACLLSGILQYICRKREHSSLLCSLYVANMCYLSCRSFLFEPHMIDCDSFTPHKSWISLCSAAFYSTRGNVYQFQIWQLHIVVNFTVIYSLLCIILVPLIWSFLYSFAKIKKKQTKGTI